MSMNEVQPGVKHRFAKVEQKTRTIGNPQPGTTSAPHEALGGVVKKKPPMAHSSPGSTSNPEEALGGHPKRKVPPAHVGPRSSSHEEETLMKKKVGR